MKLNSFNDLKEAAKNLVQFKYFIPDGVIFSFQVNNDLYRQIKQDIDNEPSSIRSSYNSREIYPNKYINTLLLNVYGFNFVITTTIGELIVYLTQNVNDQNSWYDSMNKMLKIGRDIGYTETSNMNKDLKFKDVLELVKENNDLIQTGFDSNDIVMSMIEMAFRTGNSIKIFSIFY